VRRAVCHERQILVDEILTDAEIARLVAMPKTLSADYGTMFHPKDKRGHKESDLDRVTDDGSRFIITVRVSMENPLDFTAILSYEPKGGKRIRLRRYNGKSHEHVNKIEKERLPYDFHIHYATERYQLAGDSAEAYAVVTDRYGDACNYPQLATSSSAPSRMSASRVRPRQTTMLPGGGSFVRAR
jgi:hypothetical protein